MRMVFGVTAAAVLLCLCVGAQADVFNLGPGLTNLETVRVGDASNAADTTGYGSVGYAYNIGKYEVTTSQYVDFLNQKAKTDPHGLYSTQMANLSAVGVYNTGFGGGCNIQRSGSDGNYSYSVGSGASQDIAAWGNRPVNYVSYWDACRFANWLNNGQGNSDTETGTYTLNAYNGNDGSTIRRNTGWNYAVTSQNEWYKAAYYKGGGRNAGYWNYATRTDTMPSNVGADGYVDPGNHGNFKWYDFYPYGGTYYTYTLGSPYNRTNVGEFENSASAYGTFDQSGNVCEWNEGINVYTGGCAYHGVLGGSFAGDNYGLQAAHLFSSYPTWEYYDTGFRISAVPGAPEPSSLIALAGGLVGLAGLRRRRA